MTTPNQIGTSARTSQRLKKNVVAPDATSTSAMRNDSTSISTAVILRPFPAAKQNAMNRSSDSWPAWLRNGIGWCSQALAATRSWVGCRRQYLNFKTTLRELNLGLLPEV